MRAETPAGESQAHVFERKVRRHAGAGRRSSPGSRGGQRGAVVAQRPREDPAVPGARAGTAALRHVACDAPVLLDGEVVALDARGQPATFVDLGGRLHLSGARRHRAAGRPVSPWRWSSSTCCATATATCGRCRSRTARPGSRRSFHTQTTERLRDGGVLGRRRDRWMARARAGAMGGPDRQGRGAALRERQAQPGVAQDQGRPPAGVRRGRLDRTRASRASGSASLVVGYYEPQGRRRPAARGSVGSGFTAGRPRPHPSAAGRLAAGDLPVRPGAPTRWSGPTGCGPNWWLRCRSRSGRVTRCCGTRCSWACVTDKPAREVRREGEATARSWCVSRGRMVAPVPGWRTPGIRGGVSRPPAREAGRVADRAMPAAAASRPESPGADEGWPAADLLVAGG